MSAISGTEFANTFRALLTAYEYYSVKKQVEERAAEKHRKPEFETQDRRRIMAVLRFSLFLPAGGAVMFWLWNSMS